eukprot:GHVR01032273.1.p1 GENE.GHVR01032273.1~~GHVR01032273.1.p1  ORF type:complete len:313 (-),score=62.50 GHVR01032273.1:36-974(-)
MNYQNPPQQHQSLVSPDQAVYMGQQEVPPTPQQQYMTQGGYVQPQGGYVQPQGGYVQPQGGYVQPPQQVMQTVQYHNPYDPYEMLKMCNKVYVKEQVQLLEILGIDAKNEYSVLNESKQEMFIAKETTGFYQRNCVPNNCRAIGIETFILLPGQGRVVFMNANKECQTTCCCCNRPKLQVNNIMNGKVIGHLKDEWSCCNYVFTVLDYDDEERLKVEASCCQAGIWCKLPCGSCSEVKFDISDISTGTQVGSITKRINMKGALLENMADRYWVDFGSVTEPQWKALLLSLSYFIDLRLFSGAEASQNNMQIK